MFGSRDLERRGGIWSVKICYIISYLDHIIKRKEKVKEFKRIFLPFITSFIFSIRGFYSKIHYYPSLFPFSLKVEEFKKRKRRLKG